ncbi:MAG: JAB domain-containing protein [Candidatus Kapaibacteriota bacterium]
MKLFTTAIDKQLFSQYKYGNNLSTQKVVAKIFNPYSRGTWYLLNSDPNDPDYIWAIVDLFDIEIGSVSRSELESIKVPPYNLSLERDTSFTPINAMELFKGLKAGRHYKEGGELEDYKADIQLIEEKESKNYFLFPKPSEKDSMGIMFKNGGLTSKKSWTVTISYPMKNPRSGWAGFDSIEINVIADNYEDAQNKGLTRFKNLLPYEKGTVTNVSCNEENNFSKMLNNAKYKDGGIMDEVEETEEEQKVIRGFFEDEEYEYEDGGYTDDKTDGYSNAKLLGFESQDWESQGREYAGSEWDSLTESEKEEIITMLQKDWERNTYFAKGGRIKTIEKSEAYRLTPYNSIDKDIINKVASQLQGYKFAGNFFIKGRNDDAYIYFLDEFDRDFVKNIEIKPNERIYRYITRRSAIGGMIPLVKINIENGLVYYPILSEDEETIIGFDRKGQQTEYLNLVKVEEEDYYQDGGSTNDGISFSVELNDDEDQVYEFSSREEAFSFASKKEREGNEVTSVDEYKSKGKGRHERVSDLLRSYNNYSIRLRMSSGKFADGGYMEDGGATIDDKRAYKLLNKLKEEGYLKRYYDVRGNGKKLFETIVPNKSENGLYKRYESLSESSIGTLQNEYLYETDVLNWLKKTMPKIEMSDGGYFAKGGMMYKDLSQEKPQIVNDSDVQSKKFKVEEIDLIRKGKKSYEGVPIINSSNSAVEIFRQFWDEEALSISEHMNVMLLNRANKIIGLYQHSKGGVTGTILDVEMVVLSAVKSLAKGVIVAHNHPSGNLRPSKADKDMTEKLKNALKIVDITLLDHLIITEEGFFSFGDDGIMEKGGMMADGGYMEEGGEIDKEEYIIKDGLDRYYARSLSNNGNVKWNDSQDMAYAFRKSEAESIKSTLELEGYSNLSVQKYDKDWWKKMAKGGTIYGDFKIKIEKDESPYNKDYKGLNVKVDKDGVPLKYVLKALVDYKDKDYLKQALENKTVQIFVKLYTRYVPLGHISKNTYDAFVEMENSKTMSDGGYMKDGGQLDMNVIVKTPKGIVTKKDFEGFTKKQIIEWCEQRGWVYNPKGEKLGGSTLKEYEFFIKSPTNYNVILPKMADGGMMDEVEETEDEPKVVRGFFEDEEYEYAEGGEIESKINALYVKSKFINNNFNWELKLLEMLQDGSIEAYNIYQSLSKKQKDSVLQELFETDNDMGSYGDGEIETSRENLDILLEDAKSGKRYAKGGMMADGGYMDEGGLIGGLTADESIYLYVKRGVVQLYREKYLKPIGLYNTPKMKDVEKSLIKKGFLNASGAINKLGKDKAKEVDTKIGGMISSGYLTTLELSDNYKKIVEKFESNDSMSDGGYMA